MSDRLAVFNDGPDRAGRRARPRSTSTPRPSSSPASSASRTCSSAAAGASRSAPRRCACSPTATRADGLARRGRRRRDVAYVGMVTRYVVDLDGGGDAAGRAPEPRDVVRRRRSRRAGGGSTVGWRDEQTYAIDVTEEGHVMKRIAWAAIAARRVRLGASVRAAMTRATTAVRARRRRPRRSRRPRAPKADGELGEGEGEVNLIAWAGYVEDGSTDPKVDWVIGLREGDRLPGQRQDRQHLRRDGHADAHRPVRRRVGVRRRDAAPDRRRRRRAGQHRPDPELRGRLRGPQGQAVQLGRRAVPTACRTAAARTCSCGATDEVKPAPDSWSVVFDESSPYKGKVTAYDSPIYIADAALYLKATQPDLGIDERLRARRQAVRRRRRPAQEAARDHRRVLVGLHQGAGRVHQRRLRRRHDVAGHREPARGRQGADQDHAARRRARPAGRTRG